VGDGIRTHELLRD